MSAHSGQIRRSHWSRVETQQVADIQNVISIICQAFVARHNFIQEKVLMKKTELGYQSIIFRAQTIFKTRFKPENINVYLLIGSWSHLSSTCFHVLNYLKKCEIIWACVSECVCNKNHNDIIKWKYFPRYWPFVRRIHRLPYPHEDQWRGALMFYLICVWTNGRSNNPDSGDLKRNRAPYDATVL